MIRISKHNITDITNTNKIESINSLFVDYQICLEQYIDLIVSEKLPLKTLLSSKLLPEFNIKHSRYKALIYKQSSEIIRSQITKSIDKRFKRYKIIYVYFKKNNRQQKFIAKRFAELNLKNILNTKYFIKPIIKNISINLDERFFDIEYINDKHFDCFVKIILPYFNEKCTRGIQIKVPVKMHRHSNKLKSTGFKLRKAIQLKINKDMIFVNLVWENESIVEPKMIGHSIGIDIGVKKLMVTSDRQFIGEDMELLYNKFKHKKCGSIGYTALMVQRNNLTNKCVNELKLDDVHTIVIEDLCNVKHKSELPTHARGDGMGFKGQRSN